MSEPNVEAPASNTPVEVAGTFPPVPVAAPPVTPTAAESLASLKEKIGVWDGIEPAEFSQVTDAQSRANVEAHIQEIAAKHGEGAAMEARNLWSTERRKALAGYISGVVALIAAWTAVTPPPDSKDEALMAQFGREDRETGEAVDAEIAALSRKYGEHSEVVEEARRLWNVAKRLGHSAK